MSQILITEREMALHEIYPSPLLQQLLCRKILPARLAYLGIRDERVQNWLRLFSGPGSDRADWVPETSVLDQLITHHIISVGKSFQRSDGAGSELSTVPLPFVTALNFELTYECNMSCSHCLQQKIRTRIRNEWIPTKAARQALHDAWFAGLLTTGVNFTGGEVFSARSNLVELVETARALGLAFRIYTNGWWGNRRTVSLGDMVFHSPREVIEWIHSQGVSILALSFDARYDEAPESWPPVMSIIRHCEAVGQQYQVVCTGERGQDLIDRMYRRLREHRINPAFLSPVPMESVDIGGACARAAETARGLQDLALLARRSPCETKGFARPKFLHIGPRGDVRSCLYAVGCGYLGNITRESIFQILNSFNSNPVTRLFREGETSAFLDEYFHPYQKFYRNIGHPCTASVLIARMAEELAVTTPQFVSGRRKEELHRLHLRIAEDLNLCAS